MRARRAPSGIRELSRGCMRKRAPALFPSRPKRAGPNSLAASRRAWQAETLNPTDRLAARRFGRRPLLRGTGQAAPLFGCRRDRRAEVGPLDGPPTLANIDTRVQVAASGGPPPPPRQNNQECLARSSWTRSACAFKRRAGFAEKAAAAALFISAQLARTISGPRLPVYGNRRT